MFGESESESPRVPSPWDSLISTPEPSPLNSQDSLPRLVPENDDGNVEYKLQLLSPSPARFARLVTQLKWRLLEGGGQAYYELGVADSGALVGLPRAELEQSLETLEMMAGEIGASVIVVKEIEVPAAMAGLAASHINSNGHGPSTSSTSESTTDFDDEDYDAMVSTIVLTKPRPSCPVLFSMDPELELDPSSSFVSIDLEIASVFKPRPMRLRIDTHYVGPTKTKRLKKIKHLTNTNTNCNPESTTTTKHNSRDSSTKAQARRQTRDRKREEKRRALIAYATSGSSTTTSISPSPSPGPVPFTGDEDTHDPTPEETSVLVSGLAALHVSQSDDIDTFLSGPSPIEDVGYEDDVFSPPPPSPRPPTNASGSGSRLIVEALVVRKMSLDEAFLDFGGFMLM